MIQPSPTCARSGFRRSKRDEPALSAAPPPRRGSHKRLNSPASFHPPANIPGATARPAQISAPAAQSPPITRPPPARTRRPAPRFLTAWWCRLFTRAGCAPKSAPGACRLQSAQCAPAGRAGPIGVPVVPASGSWLGISHHSVPPIAAFKTCAHPGKMASKGFILLQRRRMSAELSVAFGVDEWIQTLGSP